MGAASSLFAFLAAVSCSPPPATTPEELSTLLHDVGAGSGRSLAGRLSIETVYRPCAPPGGDESSVADCAPAPLQGAARRLLDRARRRAFESLRGDQRPVAKHTLALWHLLVDPQRDDLLPARDLLEDALALDPDDPAIHNDLAVVLLALSSTDATTLPVALEHALAVREQRPEDPAGHWNAALAAQALPLPRGARRAWEAYLALGGDPGWAAEARRRRDQIGAVDKVEAFRAQTAVPPASEEVARALVRSQPDRAVPYLLEDLLPAWAAAVSRGDPGAARGLRQSLMLVSETLHDVLGDDSGRAAVSQVIQGGAEDVIEAYARGRAALVADDLDTAEAGLREVLRRQPTGVLADWSRVWLALIAVYRGEHDQAGVLLDEIESSLDLERQPTLAGRILWHRGLSLARRGLDARSVPTFRRAEALFRRLGDRRSAASIEIMLSEDLTALGRPAEAWDLRLRALRGLTEYPRSVPLHNTLLDVAEEAQDGGWPRTAMAVAEEAVDLARDGDDPISSADAAELFGRLLASAGRTGDAARNFARAGQAAARIADDDFRGETTAGIALAEARWLPERSVPADPFSQLLAFYRERSLHHKVIEVYLAQARHRQSMGDLAGSARSLEAGLGLLVDKNRALGDVGDRLAHTEVVQSVFDALVAHHADRGDAAKALAYNECARLAPYRAWVYPRLGLPADADCRALIPRLDARRAALGEGETWLVYLSRADELLVWTLDRHGIRLDRQGVGRQELHRRVDAMAQAIADDDEDAARSAGEALWPLLRLPASGAVPPRLVVVPDSVLARLPFAALRAPGSGHWLVDDTTLSLAVQVAPRGRLASSPDSPPAGPELLVADPAFDPNFVGLERLSSARAEIDAIAASLTVPNVVAGADATRQALLDALKTAPLFHYAGHAVPNASDPFRSYLLLAAAGDPPEQQLLRADELLGVDMPHLRLVVLSACETAAVPVGRTAPAAGLAGLAMPFLLRSDAEVVATVRGVDDWATAQLIPRFYRHRAAGMRAAQALRAAQRDLLHGEDPLLRRPAAWAWVVVME